MNLVIGLIMPGGPTNSFRSMASMTSIKNIYIYLFRFKFDQYEFIRFQQFRSENSKKQTF